MGRTKTNSGGGGSSQSPLTSDNSTSTAAAETRIKDLLKELYELIHQIQVHVHGTHIVTVVTSHTVAVVTWSLLSHITVVTLSL